MKYLLDTCAISETIRSNPNLTFIEWLDSQDENEIFLSGITIGELYKGIFKLKDKERQKNLMYWLEEDLKLRFYRRILPIEDSIIYIWGKICGENEKNGKKLPIIDSLIAATAIAHKLTVVSRNTKDFEMCNLKVLNPWRSI